MRVTGNELSIGVDMGRKRRERRYRERTKAEFAAYAWHSVKWAVAVDKRTIRVGFDDGKEVLFDLINYVHDTMTKDEQREWLPIIDEGLIFEMQYDYLGVDWLYTDIGIGGAILYHEGEEVVPPHDIADDDEDIGV